MAGEVFQIATFKETTVGEIAEKIRVLVENGTGKKVDIIHTEKRLGDVQRNFSDTTKAREILGWTCNWPLDMGLGDGEVVWSGEGLILTYPASGMPPWCYKFIQKQR